MEAAVCAEMSHFEQQYMGRGPKSIECYLIRDFLIVRLQDILSPAEQELAKSRPAQVGRDLLKELKTKLIETSRTLIESMIERITTVGVLRLHHDICALTGEEVFLFSLAATPAVAGEKPA